MDYVLSYIELTDGQFSYILKEATEIWPYQCMLRISLSKHMRNDDILNKIETTK